MIGSKLTIYVSKIGTVGRVIKPTLEGEEEPFGNKLPELHKVPNWLRARLGDCQLQSAVGNAISNFQYIALVMEGNLLSNNLPLANISTVEVKSA